MVRFKNRYLVLHLAWRDTKLEANTSEGDLLKAFREAIRNSLGDKGLEKVQAGLSVRWFSAFSSVAVVRCSRSGQPQCLAAISRLSNITYRPVTIHLLRHTGSFNVCKKVALKHDAALLASRKLKADLQAPASAATQRLVDLEQ